MSQQVKLTALDSLCDITNIKNIFLKLCRILSNVERFDPQTGVWEEMAPLEVGRMGVAAAQYKDRIWVCGGMTCAKKSILSQRVDCYDTQSNM